MTHPSAAARAATLATAVQELVARVEQIDGDCLAHAVARLQLDLGDTAAAVTQAERSALASDLGWALAEEAPDVAAGARLRARLLQAAGDTPAALDTWIEAAELAAASGGFEQARGAMESALAIAVDETALTRLLARRAEHASACGAPDADECWTQLAERLLLEQDPDGAARALYRAYWASTSDRAVELLDRAATLGIGESGWATRAAALRLIEQDRLSESEQLDQRALELARRSRDRSLEALALLGIAVARSLTGDLESAIATQRQALAVARAAGDAHALDAGGFNLVMMLHDDLRSSEALAEVERLIVTREVTDRAGAVVEARAMRAHVLLGSGRLEDALAEVARVRALLAAGGCDPVSDAYARSTCARVLVDAGGADPELPAHLEELRDAAAMQRGGWFATRSLMLESMTLIDQGDDAAACAALREVEVQDNGMLGAELAVVLTWAALGARDVDGLDRAGELLHSCVLQARLPRVARRQLEAARELLQTGSVVAVGQVAEEWQRRGRTLDAGRLLLAAARASDDEARRADLATRSQRLFSGAGASVAAARARAVATARSAGHPQRLLALEDSPLFAGVDVGLRDELLAHAVDLRRPAGSILHETDEQVGSLWLLRSGRVRLCRVTEDDRRLTVELLDPGAPLGEHSLVGLGSAGSRAEAEEAVVLAAIPIPQVVRAIARSPRLGQNLLALVGARMERGRQLAERVAFWTVDRRIARCILELDERYGHPTLDGHRMLDRSFTHFQLAELVNARRETVGEFLRRMRAEGVVELRRRRIVIVDAARLERIVSG